MLVFTEKTQKPSIQDKKHNRLKELNSNQIQQHNERRQCYRKSLDLNGSLLMRNNKDTVSCIIKDISRSGIKIHINKAFFDIKAGDEGIVQFFLDDPQKSFINKKIIVSSKNKFELGCKFISPSHHFDPITSYLGTIHVGTDINQQPSEKRQYDRYRIGYGTIVVFNKPILFKLKTHVVTLGPLFDISKGGISVTYEGNVPDVEEIDTVSLINWGDKLKKIDNLPVEMVRDAVFEKNAGKVVRKLSLKFDKLTGYQTARVAYFLYSLNEIEDEETTSDFKKKTRQKVYHLS